MGEYWYEIERLINRKKSY